MVWTLLPTSGRSHQYHSQHEIGHENLPGTREACDRPPGMLGMCPTFPSSSSKFTHSQMASAYRSKKGTSSSTLPPTMSSIAKCFHGNQVGSRAAIPLDFPRGENPPHTSKATLWGTYSVQLGISTLRGLSTACSPPKRLLGPW